VAAACQPNSMPKGAIVNTANLEITEAGSLDFHAKPFA
jgi:hypothetical protein